MVYFDHNASAPLHGEVLQAVTEAWAEFGNPSSVHAYGRAARKRVEDARESVAALVGCAPENIVFTSGATEANNMALLGCGRSRIIASAVEHPSIFAVAPEDEHERIPVSASGRIKLDALPHLLLRRGRFSVVSVMAANNETGVIQPVSGAAEIAHEAGALFHCDAVQAFGRIPFNMKALGVDLVTLTAHKLGGPKGIGALAIADGLEIAPLVRGGGQERGRRGGTENVAGIAGFGVAARLARQKRISIGKVAGLIGMLERRAQAAVPGAVIFGEDVPRIANTTMMALPGIDSQTQVMALDLAGIAVSAGAACSSGKVGGSAVLRAMGIDDALARCAIRVSIGHENTVEEVNRFIEVWSGLAKKAA